ncbi:DUF3040 domain-containing protein [Hoyosella sp. G463]|uniref:DUF3040 domain-containing protein n=1 Tax=Lolliginicoccus lacisalsi TaxID=2742202 RepID=A0A927JF56_9ACTN|nr:DUF3040 domain-containing protein [Lolliginicoccus lacisalsi]
MPLSEHEQRMLEQIESALYAEDPKFASQVRSAGTRGPSTRRRMQFIALFAVGLVLLIAGLALPVLMVGGFPAVSFLGFLVMFGTGVWALLGKHDSPDANSGDKPEAPAQPPGKPGKKPPKRASGSFSERMEERFRKRFEE